MDLIEVKKSKIKSLTKEMLDDCYQAMLKKIDKALDSNCIDIEGWDEMHSRMILPKTILVAILESEVRQYDGKGTSFEREIKKDSKKIQMFI